MKLLPKSILQTQAHHFSQNKHQKEAVDLTYTLEVAPEALGTKVSHPSISSF